jgi:hypothetical protein
MEHQWMRPALRTFTCAARAAEAAKQENRGTSLRADIHHGRNVVARRILLVTQNRIGDLFQE